MLSEMHSVLRCQMFAKLLTFGVHVSQHSCASTQYVCATWCNCPKNGTRPSLDNFAHGAVHELVSPPTTEQEVLPRATAVTLHFTTPPLPSIFLFFFLTPIPPDLSKVDGQKGKTKRNVQTCRSSTVRWCATSLRVVGGASKTGRSCLDALAEKTPQGPLVRADLFFVLHTKSSASLFLHACLATSSAILGGVLAQVDSIVLTLHLSEENMVAICCSSRYHVASMMGWRMSYLSQNDHNPNALQVRKKAFTGRGTCPTTPGHMQNELHLTSTPTTATTKIHY